MEVDIRGRDRFGVRRRRSYLPGLVLGDFVLGVLLAVFALAIGAAGLGDVDLVAEKLARVLALYIGNRVK